MEDDLELISKCCTHSLPLTGYCPSCRMLVCNDCDVSTEHEHVPINKFLEFSKWNELVKQLINRKDFITSEIKRITESLHLLNEETKCNEENINALTNLLKRGDEIVSHDSKLLFKGVNMLRKIQFKAETYTLKQACSKAISFLDIEDEIIAEKESYCKEISKLEHNKSLQLLNYKNLKRELEVLTLSNEIKTAKLLSKNEKMALISMKIEDLLENNNCSINCFPNNYKAYNGVQYMDKIRHVLTNPLSVLDNKIKVSEPVVFDLLKRPNGMYGALSHNGTLAVYSELDEEDVPERDIKVVEFVNLNNWAHTIFPVEDETNIGFCNDRVIFITKYKKLRDCPEMTLFRKKKKPVLNILDSEVPISVSCDVSLIESTKVLYYLISGYKLYKYNIEKPKKSKKLVQENIYNMLQLTGIYGFGLAAYTYQWQIEYSAFHSIAAIGKHVTIPSVFLERDNRVNLAIPCCFKKNKAKKALLRYNDGKFSLSSPERFELIPNVSIPYQSPFIRLYRDIFLIYDSNKKEYLIVRIVLP